MNRSPITAAIAIALVVSVGALSGCSDDTATAATAKSAPDSSTEPVVREGLGETAPVNAPGQTLHLQRVTIAAGAKLGEHFHEGTQVAHVESGTLTYNMVSGTVVVTDANGVSTSFTGPTVVTVQAGSSLVETPDVVHFGANDGDEPVVIVLAALLADGAPLATPTGG
jgi:quercetin dioxygenase-like cupin family protein